MGPNLCKWFFCVFDMEIKITKNDNVPYIMEFQIWYSIGSKSLRNKRKTQTNLELWRTEVYANSNVNNEKRAHPPKLQLLESDVYPDH